MQSITGLSVTAPVLIVAVLVWPRARRHIFVWRIRNLGASIAISFAVAILSIFTVWMLWLLPFLANSFMWTPLLPDQLRGSFPSTVLVVVVIAIINGVFEETLWRRCVPVALQNAGLPSHLIIIISCMAFGAAHWNGLPPGWLGVGLTTCFGLASFWLLHVSGSLIPSICVHAVVDFAIILPLAGH